MIGGAPTIGVVTVAKGRREHLARQLVAVSSQTRVPDAYVVVDMGGERFDDSSVTTVLSMPVGDRLPLACARNAGARATATDLLVFLDVDCVPHPSFVADYAACLIERRALWSGPVGYLPPLHSNSYWNERGVLATTSLRSVAGYHPGRPRPGHARTKSERYELLWSLSFASDADTWARLGGFDERFEGYGAEDTDLAFTARSLGVEHWFTGDAEAFHQYHPISSPPVEHLDDICRNATRFHAKWGCWPMEGWLDEFARSGLVEWVPEAGRLRVRH